MMIACRRLAVVVVTGWLAAGLTGPASGADDKAGIAFFEQHIRPVLVEKCYGCHSADAKEPKGGLLLDTREGIRAGGDTGRAVVPGSVEDSVLIEALRFEGLEMPPNDPLPEDVIAKFEQWIRMGAPDPRDDWSTPIRRTIDFDKAREFWAFQPVRRPDVPNMPGDWATTDIDRFILATLTEKDLAPVRDADPHVLLRRVYFDLIGLPPAPEQIDEFVSAAAINRTAALEAVVDRLLASPQFGERWGRHWLDVVRFGESTGMERNATYPWAWRYRDWVIRAFNSDKAFDEFIREQVAGDLLPSDSADQKRDRLIATGLLAIGPKSLNDPNRESFQMDVVDEQIDVVSRAFLGLTAACARCHDHKFDPIPQTEYYALAGIFTSTETFYGTVQQAGNRNAGRLLAFADGQVSPMAFRDQGRNAKATAKTRPAAVDDLRKDLNAARRRLEQLQNQTAKNPAAKKKNEQAAGRLEKQIAELEEQLRAARQQANAKNQAAPSGDGEAASAPPPELIMAVLDASNPADTALRVRGEPGDHGSVVPRGFPTIGSVGHVPAINPDGSGRKELADWLTQADNPLTARVAVNRVWQHLFGRGIVETVDNFGTTGERPTHPELLDWLATGFTSGGWSVKKLVRQIVLSRTYGLAGEDSREALAVDPDNRLLWRASHRRLEAEAIRDAILAASGRLDLTPPDGSPVAKAGDGLVGQNLRPEQFAADSPHRSVYLPIVRGAVPELLHTFDFPEPSMIAGQREVTTVATQALYMMNSGFVAAESRRLAERLLSQPGLDDAGRVRLAWWLTLGRSPADTEQTAAEEFVRHSTTTLGAGSAAGSSGARNTAAGSSDPALTAWSALAQALFASAEFRYLE